MDKFLKINLFNKVLAIVVFASVLFSFFLEFFLNLIPCKLCLYQRYLWLFLLLACILNIKQSSKGKYLEIIIKKAESIKSSRGPTGFKNVEVELNSSWWRKNEFKILITPGLFKHNRLSNRGY